MRDVDPPRCPPDPSSPSREQVIRPPRAVSRGEGDSSSSREELEPRDVEGSQWAVVEVQDKGIGIPAGDLPHLFERFYRGENVVGRIPGTGLGLFGARQIVEQHGGRIEVKSVEGQGSTFSVWLPQRLPAPAAP